MRSLFKIEPPMTHTNVAVMPDGTIRPWRGVKTTEHPPVLQFDGQVFYLHNWGASYNTAKALSKAWMKPLNDLIG